MALNTQNRAALLKKMAAAKAAGGGGNKVRDGQYVLVVKALKIEEGFKGQRFVADFYVKSSKKIPVQSAKNGAMVDVEPNPAGSFVSVVQMLTKHEGAMERVKRMLLTLVGHTEETCSDEDYLDTLDFFTGGTEAQVAGTEDPNPAAGLEIGMSTYRTLTKAQLEITALDWQTLETSDEAVVLNRSLMDSAKEVKADKPVAQAAPAKAAPVVAEPAAVVAQPPPAKTGGIVGRFKRA